MAQNPGTRAKHRSPLQKQRQRWGLVFIAPQFISIMLFGIIPIIAAFFIGFLDYNGFRGAEFVGIQNFARLFTDPDTLTAVKNTFVFVLVYTPLLILISLGLSLLLNKALGKLFYRAAIFLPQIVNSVAIAAVWSWIYQPQIGILNVILEFFGLPGQNWLRDPNLAMISVIIMCIWQMTGYNVVLFLAGLQNVPQVYVEAAVMDGANKWDVFRNITLPMISPTTVFVTLMTLINAFQAFDQFQLLTEGGPAQRTYTLTLHIYQTAFKKYRMGEASAIAMVLFLIVIVFSLAQNWISEKFTYYGD